MRNSMSQARGKKVFLVSGQSYTPLLPWFKGSNQRLEPENQAIFDYIAETFFPSVASQTIDIHSGFGIKDRLWYPYGRSNSPFPELHKVRTIAKMLKEVHPYHVYKIEPQSDSYLIDGDIWDQLYDNHLSAYPQNCYIPWTLELGSWMWIRKNPRQLFSVLGAFNPIKPHRYKRIMRRHWPLLEYMITSTHNHHLWSQQEAA